MENKKVYKQNNSNDYRMFPGDPMGLPDDFFLISCLMFGGKI